MNDFVNDERDSKIAFPYPLASGGLMNYLGTLAPPAVMLSWTSLVAGLVVLILLQWNEVLRVWFTIDAVGVAPQYARGLRLGLLVFTVLWAWLIAWICRLRPGPLLPRIWIMFLAFAASALLGLQFVPLLDLEFSTALSDALSLAFLASVFVLGFRLFRFHPDSPWTQRIAPVSLSIVLVLLVPALWWIADNATRFQTRAFQTTLAQMQRKTSELELCAEQITHCEKNLLRANQEYLRQISDQPRWQDSAKLLGRTEEFAASENALLGALLNAVSQKLQLQIVQGVENWRQSGLQGIELDPFQGLLQSIAKSRNTDLQSAAIQAYNEILATLAAQLRNDRTKFGDAPVLYTRERHENWPMDQNFAVISQNIVRTYRNLKQLHDQLESIAKQDSLAFLRNASDSNSDWNNAVESLATDWTRHWAISLLREETAFTPELATLLEMTVLAGIPANSEQDLLQLTQDQAESHKAESNCEWIQSEEASTKSLQCRTFEVFGEVLQMAAELRLVYTNQSAKPHCIVYFFPIPIDTERNIFIGKVQDALPKTKKFLRVFMQSEEAKPSGECTVTEQKVTRVCVRILRWNQSQDFIYIVLYNY